MTAAVGITAVAGCTGDTDAEATENGDSNGGDDGGEFLENEPEYDGWFDDVDNYEGTVDARTQATVEVLTGSEGGLAYTPPAVAISTGTTVVWEWTGEGGDHNVSAEDGSFESETTGDDGFQFEHTFEEPGIYEYVCTPHEALGMKGAIYVE